MTTIDWKFDGSVVELPGVDEEEPHFGVAAAMTRKADSSGRIIARLPERLGLHAGRQQRRQVRPSDEGARVTAHLDDQPRLVDHQRPTH